VILIITSDHEDVLNILAARLLQETLRAGDSGSMSLRAGGHNDQWRNQLGFAPSLRNEESCYNIKETSRGTGLDCQGGQQPGDEGQRYEGTYSDLSKGDDDCLVHIQRLHEAESRRTKK
jgi:hypothetical protein